MTRRGVTKPHLSHADGMWFCEYRPPLWSPRMAVGIGRTMVEAWDRMIRSQPVAQVRAVFGMPFGVLP